MTVVSLDMAYRSFLEVLAGSHPPRYAASLKPSSPRFTHSSQRGSRFAARTMRCAATLYSVGPCRTRTMMQASASTTRLPGGGPSLESGPKTMSSAGLPPPPERQDGWSVSPCRTPCRLSGGRRDRLSQPDPVVNLAGLDHPPQGDQQLAGERHDHRHARPSTPVGGTLAIPSDQGAVLLKDQETPGELDHAAPYPRVSGTGQASLPAPRSALVGRPR